MRLFHFISTAILFHVSSSKLIRSVDTVAAMEGETQHEANYDSWNSRGRDTASCGENEEWVRCRSSSCFDKLCDQVLYPEKTRPCTRDCKSGCACKEGYVREKSDGLCYKEDICYSGYYEQ